MFKSTKRFGPITTNHRNWHAAFNTNRNSQKCSFIHGYSRYCEIVFVGDYDSQMWVMDFGDLKDVKQWLEDKWDHKTLISSDDPELEKIKEMDELNILRLTEVDVQNGLEWGPGLEGSCKWVFDVVGEMIRRKTHNRVAIESVRIWEHENNSTIYLGEIHDYKRLGYPDDQCNKFFPRIRTFME